MNNLVSKVFEMEASIREMLPEGYENVGSGMFMPRDWSVVNTLWRDMEVEGEGEDYSFSYSTNGDVEGDVPPVIQEQLTKFLLDYKVGTPDVEVSNVPEDPENP